MKLEIDFNPDEQEYPILYEFLKYCMGEIYENPGVTAYNLALSTVVQMIQVGQMKGELDVDVTPLIYNTETKEEMAVKFTVISEDGLDFKILLSEDQEENVVEKFMPTPEALEELFSKERMIKTIDKWSKLYAEFHYGPMTESNQDDFEQEVVFFKEGMMYVFETLKKEYEE